MGTPAIPDLGQHCFRDDCHQLDFLPFTCNACHQVFCLEHRQYSSHDCPNANDHDVKVIVCSLCQKSIRTVPNEDENVTWEHHFQTNCDPSNYDKATKKPRCPVRGCKEVLVFSSKVFCNDCKRDVCVKHRFGLDHGCEEFQANRSNNRGIGHYRSMFMKSFKDKTAAAAPQPNGRATKQAARDGAAAASSSSGGILTGLYASVEAGINKLGVMVSSGSSSGRQTPRQTASRAQEPRAEECPQCGAGFANVALLIKHVESVHDVASPTGHRLLDVCPRCGLKFRDPIQLVFHVERDHRGSSS